MNGRPCASATGLQVSLPACTLRPALKYGSCEMARRERCCAERFGCSPEGLTKAGDGVIAVPGAITNPRFARLTCRGLRAARAPTARPPRAIKACRPPARRWPGAQALDHDTRQPTQERRTALPRRIEPDHGHATSRNSAQRHFGRRPAHQELENCDKPVHHVRSRTRLNCYHRMQTLNNPS